MSSIRICTLACHALMVPCVLRRASEGLQGPEYQLEAVELAVIRWSSISRLSIPRGTEQPETGGQKCHIYRNHNSISTYCVCT